MLEVRARVVSATSSGVPTGWSVHRLALPLRSKISAWTRSASARGVADDRRSPMPVVRSISAGSRPTVSQCWSEDRLLAPHAVDAAADVVGVGVAGHQLERDLLAAATDEQGQPLLDRRRVVADVLRRRSAVPAAVGRSPWSIPRMIGSASPSQRSRSGGPDPEREPERRVLLLEPGRADAEDGPAAGDVVERRGHLRGQRPARGTCWRRPSARSGSARWPAPRPRASASPRTSARRELPTIG